MAATKARVMRNWRLSDQGKPERVAATSVTKSKSKSIICAARHSLGGAVMLLALSAQAQKMFVAAAISGNVYIYTPDGTRSTFANDMSALSGLAFDSAGSFFVANYGSSNIVEITPNGTTNIFASGIETPTAIAFQPGPPALTIALTAPNTILITWPAPSTGYVLEQNTVLGATNWVLNTNTVSVVNATNNMFFQLLNP